MGILLILLAFDGFLPNPVIGAGGFLYAAMLTFGLAAVGYMQLSDYPAGVPVGLFNML